MPKTISKTLADPNLSSIKRIFLWQDGEGAIKGEVTYNLLDTDGGLHRGNNPAAQFDGITGSTTVSQLAAKAIAAIKEAEGYDS